MLGVYLCVQACSIPAGQTPTWERDPSDIVEDLKQLGGFEAAEIRWRALDLEEPHHTLYLKLHNGQIDGQDNAQMRELGRKSLQLVAESIGNESDYDALQAIFVNTSSTGPVKSSSEVPFEYTIEEIK